MRLQWIPEDFQVAEEVRFPPDGGPYALYRVWKRGATTLEVQARLARALRLPLSAVVFPALKDRNAVAVQYATVRGQGPERLSGPGFTAEQVGWVARPLTSSDLLGNQFAITVRDLSLEEAHSLGQRLAMAAEEGLPNYFDQQRFGSRTASGDFPGRRILQRDAEGALRAYLAEPLAGDPPDVRAFKREAAAHWGQWRALLEMAPRPSNLRSVLTFLCDHPADFRRALNLITPRVLSLYLAAYQSFLWNRIAAGYLQARLGSPSGFVTVAGEQLPLFSGLADRLPPNVAVPLPHHRAVYEEPALAAIAEEVLRAEGLSLSALKPRLLRQAYLSRGNRRLVLRPTNPSASPPLPDDCFPGRWKVTLSFALPPGSYATLVVRAVFAGST
ncbi:MAG: tRNA pseudouridine(13) synthase TruD [Anaerolineae bacterium]|nr:tRNA pseudouridine(13) synthase TruD [Anaerolineae bacterium]MDW8068755.1 tRNA pseudouridine(13) synthase TruD [Anaerolineae bacterium]